MANYRRQLSKSRHEFILNKYKNHRDVEGGIFTSDKRRKLLGVKAESSKQFREDTADFWYDVRTTVKNGLTDLQLIAEVAHPEQLKEMFQLVPFAEWEKDNSKTSLANILDAIFQDHDRLVLEKTKDGHKVLTRTREENDLWKVELAYETVEKCLKFYKESGLITSRVHERLADEVIDMMGSEYSHALSRNLDLPYYAKFR